MANIIIVTHSTLAQGFIEAAKMIDPTIKNIDVVCFENGCSIDTLIKKIKSYSDKYNKTDKKYIIVTDMAGASPFNASLQATINDDIYVIGGINLPILLELSMLPENFTKNDILNIEKMACESIKVLNTGQFTK